MAAFPHHDGGRRLNLTNPNLQRWNDHLTEALELTSIGISLFDACRKLSIPWEVILQLRADDSERYESLLRKPSPSQSDVQAPPPPTRRTTNKERHTRRATGTVLRHYDIAKLGGISQVTLRELIAWSPISIPTPERDGQDKESMYWSLDRRSEWITWFRDYHNAMEARPPA